MSLNHKQRLRKYGGWAFRLRMLQQSVLLTHGHSADGLRVDDLIEAFEKLADESEKDIRCALGLIGRAGRSISDEEQNDLWEIGLTWLFLAEKQGFGVLDTLRVLHKEIVGTVDPELRYSKSRRQRFMKSGGSNGFNQFELAQKAMSLVDCLEVLANGTIMLWVADPAADLKAPPRLPQFLWDLQCPQGYRLARWDWDPPL